MRVIYGIGSLNKIKDSPKVVTVGVFDGVHRAHQKILRQVLREAQDRGLLSAVVTFTPHPLSHLNHCQKVPSLTSLEHKLLYIQKEGIDICYVIRFTNAFANLSPEEFIEHLLIKKIGMVSLYAGEDFIFGRRGAGDKRLLMRLSRKCRFKLHILKEVKLEGRVISSTLIRTLIRDGRLSSAKRFLGRPVSFLGRVIRGEGLGRRLGFPTANIKPDYEVLAPDGIYATVAFCCGRIFKSVTYIGNKPTFKKINPARACSNKVKPDRSIEVFLFGTKKSIYRKSIEVRFIKKIRDSKKFSSPEELIARIKRDVAAVRKIFKNRH